MERQTTAVIKRDFLEWSGGFPPDSEDQIFLYVEYGALIGSDEQEVRTVLRQMMEEEENASMADASIEVRRKVD